MATTSSMQAWFYRGREAVPRDDDPVVLARVAFAAADHLVARTEAAERRECGAGCAFCCHFPVGVTPVEVLAMREAVRARGEALATRVATAARQREALSWRELATARLPCALLDDDGRCSIYADRPIACRGWSSLSRAQCERQFAGESGAPMPDAEAYAACLGIHCGLGDRSPDGDTHELTSALHRALDGGDELVARWRAGEAVFSGCTPAGGARVNEPRGEGPARGGL